MANGPPCAGCGAALDASALVHETAFPHDDAAVIALLRGDLNRLACRRCGARTLVVTETAVVWGASGRRVELSPAAPADMQPGAGGQIVRTVEELQSVVWGWFGEHAAPALSAINSGIGADAERVDLVDTFSPLFLRAFRAGIDGLLPRTLGFANDPEAVTKEGIHAIVVGSQAVRIGLLCVDRGDLAALPAELAERIPRPCITREVVDGLARRCVDTPPSAASGTDGFREAFATTIVHALLCERAGRRVRAPATVGGLSRGCGRPECRDVGPATARTVPDIAPACCSTMSRCSTSCGVPSTPTWIRRSAAPTTTWT